MLALLDCAAQPIVAHRGASAIAPENTLAAFTRAVGAGADAIELDVHVTADDVPVVLHDPTLDRTTDRAGAVAALPLSDVCAADAGARFSADGGRTFPFRGQGLRVPTLEEVLAAVPATPLLIELKTPHAQPAVRRAIERHDAAARCVIASFDAAALTAFPVPPFLVGAATPDVRRHLLLASLGLPSRPRCRLFAVPERRGLLPVVTRRFVAAAHRAGRPVHVWTVDDPATARRLRGRGVNGIITNDPAAMREALTAPSRP
jgi:glycerophosphoryl diester phosphodiesterase